MKIKNVEVKFPIIQGGMGIGYSNYTLAGTVTNQGGLGVLSSAGIDKIISLRHGRKFKHKEAITQDVIDAKAVAHNGPIGINIMCAVLLSFEDSILGAMDGGVDVIISGAGLPITLPVIAKTHPRYDDVALVPIVSSGRACELIIKKWLRNSDRLPDAVVVEGPMAGGHLGWRKAQEIENPDNKLENLIIEVLEVVKKYGDIPVIAAGGVYTKEDIQKFIDMGCIGVQMGTRFLATHESGASEEYKKALIDANDDGIEVAIKPGSPSGLPFRVLTASPFYQESLAGERPVKCTKGWLLDKNNNCKAKSDASESFCICNGLLSAAGLEDEEKELYTVGETASRIKKIISVKELMDELT